MSDVFKKIDSVQDITKREFFAAAALQGLCTNQTYFPGGNKVRIDPRLLALIAAEVADALIAELNK